MSKLEIEEHKNLEKSIKEWDTLEKIIEHSTKRYEIAKKELEKHEAFIHEEIEELKERIQATEEVSTRNIAELKELNVVCRSLKE